MTLTDIIRNAFDRVYTPDRAAADLGAFMMERELIRRRGEQSPSVGKGCIPARRVIP
jgi:hypothetical protein